MRKLINNPENVVDELIEGFVLSNKSKVRRIKGLSVVARNDVPINGKVGIVIGGGSGHEPLFLEYVGKGMADVAVQGQVFTAPTPDKILEGIKVADGGIGVILLYNNYSGDVLNFNMAQELARDEGIKVETVLINDEISSAPIERQQDRRGTTADHIIIKMAGAASEAGISFKGLIKLLKKAIFNSRSLGVSLSACSIPEIGKPTFKLEEGKMEFGMGIHGEAGIKKVDLMDADNTVITILDYILEDLPYREGDEVIVVINGYGSTTKMELFIAARKVHFYMKEKKISIYSIDIGEFCTSQEMAGISITLVKLDEEMKRYYKALADSPGYVKIKI